MPVFEVTNPEKAHAALTISFMEITLTELEQAINYWRTLRPSRGEERALSPEVNALATAYALMIFNGVKSIPASALDQTSFQLLESWRQQQG